MRVLLTGSTGFIGRRLLIKIIEEEGLHVRLLVRNKKAVSEQLAQRVEIVEGDAFDAETLKNALRGIDVCYYFLHSLNVENYKQKDKELAQSFIDIAEEMGVRRIIYLGGLGREEPATSEHLLSRLETGNILSSSTKVQTIWFRAGVIIGSGSASFEIIRNLTEKLPVMTTPKWVDTLAQPIAIDDVLAYLQAGLHVEVEKNLVVDIGSEQLSYKQMMLKTAEALGLKRYIIPLPFMSINISSYWLNLFTPVPFSVAKALILGLSSEVVMQNDNARLYFPQIVPRDYTWAVKQAVREIEQNQVISRWNDSGGKVWEKDHAKEFSNALFMDRRIRNIGNIPPSKIYETFTSLGGEVGWFDYDFLWEIRGIIDKMLGGVGLKRGRRSACDLRTGDCLDFWKVVDLQKDERLLLYAQMIVPGSAWLEFKIENNTLIQSAYFYPKGVWGRLYWYGLMPLHYLVFNNMIDSILNKAKQSEG